MSEHIYQILASVAFAILGAMTRLLQLKDKNKLAILNVIAEILGAAFFAILVTTGGVALNANTYITGTLSGIIGLIGGKYGILLVNWGLKKLGLPEIPLEELEPPSKEKKK